MIWFERRKTENKCSNGLTFNPNWKFPSKVKTDSRTKFDNLSIRNLADRNSRRLYNEESCPPRGNVNINQSLICQCCVLGFWRNNKTLKQINFQAKVRTNCFQKHVIGNWHCLHCFSLDIRCISYQS